ncbi:MAG: T9SS type A sorting domain-containing protein [Candidatus Kapabacteria bacterium]|nr:T9SS type A sorting domain-containing protein [Candidatus Kapabacteria bacterium]
MLKNKIIFVLTILLLFGETKADWKVIDSSYQNKGLYQNVVAPRKTKCYDNGFYLALYNLNGNMPLVRRSLDYGKTWEETLIDTATFFNNVFYWPSHLDDIDCIGDDCYAVGDSNFIWKSKDKAKTWVKLETKFTKRHTDGGMMIKCYKDLLLSNFETKYFNYIYNSTDHGLTWDSSKVQISDTIGKFFIENYILIDKNIIKSIVYSYSKDKSFLCSSNDKGKNWSSYNYTPKRIVDLHFFNANNGLSIGSIQFKDGSSYYSSYLAKTVDGGKTWTTVLDTNMKLNGGFRKIQFVDDNNGIAFGPFELWKTSDGGNSWKKDTSFNEKRFPPNDGFCSDATLLKDGRILVLNSYRGKLWENNNWVTSVEDNPTTINNISYYPNPCKDYLNIKLESESLAREELEIYDLMGQNLISQKIESIQTSIDIQKLNTGIYYCKLKQNGTVFKFEVVK